MCQDDRRFYVYQYVRDDGSPYYIGKGTGKRMHVAHKTVKIPNRERRLIIKDGLTNQEAKELEGGLISLHKRVIDGGILENIKINQWACYTGWTHSADTKKRISESNTGKIRTAAQRSNYSGPKTIEHRDNIRKANVGRPRDGRYEKAALILREMRWFTNGLTTKMFIPGQEELGFTRGRKLKV